MARGKALTRELKRKIVRLMNKEGLSRSAVKERLGVSDWHITKARQCYSKFVDNRKASGCN